MTVNILTIVNREQERDRAREREEVEYLIMELCLILYFNDSAKRFTSTAF